MKKLIVLFAFLLFVAAPAYSQSAVLEGQIVCCVDCWVRADRTKVPYGTRADQAKAAECIANGDPTLLAVMDNRGNTTFYQLESGKYQRPSKDWLPFIGMRVRIEGPVSKKKDVNLVQVDVFRVLARAPAASEQQPKAIGVEAELELNDLHGIPQKLSNFRGRIVVLNFWATYCLPCREEMPALAAIQNQYAAFGVQVIGASADLSEARKQVLQFIKETKINFPVWLEASTQHMTHFGLGPALPGTAIIDRDGKIAWLSRGVVNEAQLKQQLDAMLQQSEKELASLKTRPADVSSVPS